MENSIITHTQKKTTTHIHTKTRILKLREFLRHGKKQEHEMFENNLFGNEKEQEIGFRRESIWLRAVKVHMCLPKKILKWCSNHAKKHLRYKFKILCSVHSITIKINFNIFYHKIKALWIFIMCGLSKCLIRMKNNSPSAISQWRKIYLLLKMFGGHNTRLVDVPDGGKTRDFVSVLKRKRK